MEIQKYKAKILDSDQVVIGYITETRKYLGNGSYDNKGTSYLMTVTEKSMVNGNYGTHLINESTIEKVYFCPVCNKAPVIDKYKNSACSAKCYDEL